MSYEMSAKGCESMTELKTSRGFFALILVVLLLTLTVMALIGPYHLALADWHSTRQSIANSPDS
jgi:hypothetical protein